MNLLKTISNYHFRIFFYHLCIDFVETIFCYTQQRKTVYDCNIKSTGRKRSDDK